MIGKVYVITGATSGIGQAILKVLAKNNTVFAGYRDETKIQSLKDIAQNVIPFYIDMTDRDSISKAAEFINSKCNNIDTLINAAGCVVAGPVETLDIAEIQKQFNINTFSHLDFSQKLMAKLEGGKIINISSMASFGVFPFVAPYCASKRSLDILFNSMSWEFSKNIKIISVKPGVIATPLWDKSIKGNSAQIENCSKDYQKQMQYLVQNAKNNGQNGLSVQKVVDLILKIDTMKNPRTSYTIGRDAKFAEVFSKLPFDVQAKLIKLGMKLKFRH